MDRNKLRELVKFDDATPRVAELAALFLTRAASVKLEKGSAKASFDPYSDRYVVDFPLRPSEAAAIAEKLVNLAEELQNYAVLDCNQGLNERQEARRDRLSTQVVEIGEALDFRVETSGDPRGHVVKLYDPLNSSAGDGWGGGWGVYR